MAHTTGERREALAIALEPSVAGAVRVVARKDPEFFGELLSPTIGAAVRRAVADAIAAMLERLNQALERSMSPRSIRWRLEARRTGRPFAEVVLLRTLLFRVEQVFLIHSETGLVLHHAALPDIGFQSPDQVASMLAAIDAFVHEAFRPIEPGIHLRELALGELKVWVDRDRWLTIAAVVRGAAPREYATVLQETRERIYLQHQADLARFRADISPFAASRQIVESCLMEQRTHPPRRAHIILLLLAAALAGVVAYSAGRSHVKRVARAQMVAQIERTLESEPGIVVTSAAHARGQYRIAGFRDPLAIDPAQLLARTGLPRAQLDFAPFLSLDPRMTSLRARQALQPPQGVELRAETGVLSASGVAPRSWIARARTLAPLLPGVQRLDDRKLHSAETMARVRSMAAALRAMDVRFPAGSARPSLDQKRRVARVAALGQRLVTVARETNLAPCVTIVGHADSSGTEATNLELSHNRAAYVAASLRSFGVDASHVRAFGTGTWKDQPSSAEARSVTFDVSMADSDRAAGACVSPP